MPDPAETTPVPPPGGEPRGSKGRPARPRARERGRMRRRLRQQKRMREALLLDLGALVYELHRHSRREPELLQAKAAELTAVDQEVRALADALEVDESVLALVAAGIAGSCENCGSLLSTDARYCAACGAPAVPALGGPVAATPHGALTEPLPEPEPYEDYEPAPGEPEPALGGRDPLGGDERQGPGDGEEPLAEEPLDEEPLDEEPLAEEPLSEEPLAEEPVAEEPLGEGPSHDEEPVAPWLADPETRQRPGG